eukprot:gene12434-15632_t
MSIAVQAKAAFLLLDAMTDFASDQSISKDANVSSWSKHRRALHEEAVQLVESMPDFTPDTKNIWLDDRTAAQGAVPTAWQQMPAPAR